MSKDIFETSEDEHCSISKATLEGVQSSQDISHDEIEGAFYNAAFGDEGQKINIGGLTIWMTAGNILNYKVTAPSETSEGTLSILVAMSLMNDITLKEKILPVEDDNSRILNYLYRLIESSDFEPVEYIKDLITKSEGKFNINAIKSGYALPLIYALKYGTTFDVVECLVEEFGCYVNTPDQNMHSPLYYAFTMRQNIDLKNNIVRYLISKKASLTPDEITKFNELSSSTNNVNDFILALDKLQDNDDMPTVKKTFVSNSDKHIKQVALAIEESYLIEDNIYFDEPKQVSGGTIRSAIGEAAQTKKKIPLEGTNFILEKKENGSLNVSNDANSEVFTILSKIAKEQKAEFGFIYDKYRADSVETFIGDNYEDLICQVLESDKGFFLPQADLILQKSQSNIECFCGEITFSKLNLLCDIALEIGQSLSCDALSNAYTMPEEVWLSGGMDLPD